MRKLIINQVLMTYCWVTAGLWIVFAVWFFNNIIRQARQSELSNPFSGMSLFEDFFALIMLITFVGLILAIVATVRSSKAKIPLTGHVLAIVGFALGVTLAGLFVGQIVLLILAGILIQKKQRLVEVKR